MNREFSYPIEGVEIECVYDVEVYPDGEVVIGTLQEAYINGLDATALIGRLRLEKDPLTDYLAEQFEIELARQRREGPGDPMDNSV